MELQIERGFVRQTQIAGPSQSCTSFPSSSSVPSSNATNLKLTIVSRRSIERPGLRYQRRGINAEGGAANFVETEFVVEAEVEDLKHVVSYVQTRGSSQWYPRVFGEPM